MLSGKEVSFLDSLNISVTGLVIVMLELALLALFVIIMSKLLAPLATGQKTKTATSTAAPVVPAPVTPTANSGIDEEELAAIMVAVCEESGLKPEEIVFHSINEIK